MNGSPTPSISAAAFSRLNDGWLSVPERRAIAWLAPRLPEWLNPDRLTALGFAGSIAAFIGYVAAEANPDWLWLVNLGLVINWFGDSLDGNVARLRAIERPRYGFFLDQSIDRISHFLFAMGLGLSGFVRMEIAAIGIAIYLMMTVQSLLRAQVTGIFHLATGRLGLTEVRCIFFAVNVLFFFLPPRPFGEFGGIAFDYADVLGLVWIVGNATSYLLMMVIQLKKLADEEPRLR